MKLVSLDRVSWLNVTYKRNFYDWVLFIHVYLALGGHISGIRMRLSFSMSTLYTNSTYGSQRFDNIFTIFININIVFHRSQSILEKVHLTPLLKLSFCTQSWTTLSLFFSLSSIFCVNLQQMKRDEMKEQKYLTNKSHHTWKSKLRPMSNTYQTCEFYDTRFTVSNSQ